MRTLTVFEYYILSKIINKETLPITRNAINSVQRLADIGLVKVGAGNPSPISGSSYSYRGSSHTIK